MAKKVITPRDHVPSNENIDIAIIGMSINMPGAKNIETFWENIHSKIDSWGKFSKNRRYDVENLLNFMGIPLNSIEYDTGVFLDEIDKFDYNFFKISPREAGYTDPHHRLFLQTAWQAFEDAGYGGKKLMGSNTGVYVGFSPTGMYMRLINEVDPASSSSALVGNTTAVASEGYPILWLKGPNVVIDTACSSSMVAIHTACKAIKNGDVRWH